MKIYTYQGNTVFLGAYLEEKLISDLVLKIVSIGEEGRGRKEDYIIVKSSDNNDIIENISLHSYSTGRLYMEKCQNNDDAKEFLLVLKEEGGFRGSIGYKILRDTNKYFWFLRKLAIIKKIENYWSEKKSQKYWDHQGYDWASETPEWKQFQKAERLWEKMRDRMIKKTMEDIENANEIEILVEGNTADGMAGGMSHYPQYIVKVKQDCIIRVKKSGRMYGNPNDYCIIIKNGKPNLIETKDLDLFI